MTETESVEVYFSAGTHLGVEFGTAGSVLLPVDRVVEGERFSQRLVVETYFDDNWWRLTLSWSPSRAGDERIPWDKLNKKQIDARNHPLFGTKNEQAGLYHETLPAGCYVCREHGVVNYYPHRPFGMSIEEYIGEPIDSEE